MADRIDVNEALMGEILRSDAVLRDLRRRGEAIAAAAGAGHGIYAEIGRTRARVSVFTDSVEAMLGEAKDHRLLRALDAGR